MSRTLVASISCTVNLLAGGRHLAKRASKPFRKSVDSAWYIRVRWHHHAAWLRTTDTKTCHFYTEKKIRKFSREGHNPVPTPYLLSAPTTTTDFGYAAGDVLYQCEKNIRSLVRLSNVKSGSGSRYQVVTTLMGDCLQVQAGKPSGYINQ